MHGRSLLSIVLVLAPVVANAQLFDKIRNKQVITVVLPSGQCDAKVVGVAPDQLTLKLKETTHACGQRHSLVALWRDDVRDVVDNRPRGRRPEPSLSRAGVCTVLATTIVAATAGQYLGETGHDGEALSTIAGGGIGGAAVCYGILFPRGPRYSVFSVRIAPIQP